MARKAEPLNGGLVTSRDPAVLEEGELSAIQNAEYRPGSQALQRVKGRALFATASTTAVVGLRDVKFDNGDHYLIAHASNLYFKSAVGDTGTFASFDTVTAGTKLERIHFANRFYLLNGANDNRVFYLSATATGTTPSVRRMGLLAVDDTPTTTLVASTFSQDVTGYYEYWTTEVMKTTADGKNLLIESTFSGDPATIFVNSTASAAKVEMPSTINPEATHWRVYRSAKKDHEKDKLFPFGLLVGDQAISTANNIFTDTSVVASASALPTLVNTSGFNSGWATATGLTADDGTAARGTFTALGQRQGAYGFNHGGFVGSVRGITVELEAKASVANTPLSVQIGAPRLADGSYSGVQQQYIQHTLIEKFSTSAKVASKSFHVSSTAFGVYTLGGSADTWLRPDRVPWSDSDFSGNNFMVVLRTNGLSIIDTRTIDVDYVKVTVHYAAGLDTIVPFPSVVINDEEATGGVGRNGPPPKASTGDVFEDHVVLNDVDAPSTIRWSTPGDPESFPVPYSMDFETPDNAAVTLIRTLNNRVIVGMTNWLWRVNYLPEETDANFSRGRAREVLSSQLGVVNEMCGCVYTEPNGQQKLAGVHDSGIFSTDGFNIEDLTEDLKWSTIIATANSQAIALINDPENSKLLFYFRNDSLGTESYRRLGICYGKDHRKANGKVKIDGPTFVRNKSGANFASLESAWSLRRSTGRTGIYQGYGSATAAGGGSVYFDTSTAIPANDPAFGFTTRRMYLAGMSNEWRANEIHYYLSNQSGTQTLSVSALTTKTMDTAGEVSAGAKTSTIGGQLMGRVSMTQGGFGIGGEGIRFQFAITTGHDDLAMETLIVDGEDFDSEESGK